MQQQINSKFKYVVLNLIFPQKNAWKIVQQKHSTFQSQIEVPNDIRKSKSGNMAHFGVDGLNFKTCKFQMVQDQVSGEGDLRWHYICFKCSMETSRNLVKMSPQE